MKSIYLFTLLFIAIISKGTYPIIRLTQTPHAEKHGDTTYRIIPSESNTYGYEILVNNKLLISQKNIPGLPGNKGFCSKYDAINTARLVIRKLQQGEVPPTITTKELDSMKIKLPHF